MRSHHEGCSRHAGGNKPSSHAVDSVLERMKDIHGVDVCNIDSFKFGQLMQGFFRDEAFAVYGIDSYCKDYPVAGQKWLWRVMVHDVFLMKGVVMTLRWHARHSGMALCRQACRRPGGRMQCMASKENTQNRMNE
jgi:hypothetical protein